MKSNRNKNTNRYTANIFQNIVNTTSLQVLVIILIAAYYFTELTFDEHIQDDAFISMRYAENLASGNGLVFNDGERTEGFTSPFFIFVLALADLLGFNIQETAAGISRIMGGLSLISLWYLSFTLSRNKGIKETSVNQASKFFIIFANLLPALLLALYPPYRYWSSSGMEFTLYFTFLFTGIALYLSGDSSSGIYLTSIFLTVASLIRPEGFIPLILTILHYLVSGTPVKNLFEHFKASFSSKIIRKIFGIVLVPSLAYFVFRLLYFGYPLPNTFYAKAGISLYSIQSGIEYIIPFLESNWILTSIFCILLFLTIKNKIFFHPQKYLFFVITAIVVSTVLIGGDIFPLFRFLLPVYSLMIVFCTGNITTFFTLSNNAIIKYASAIALLFLVSFNQFYRENENMKKTAEYLIKEKALVKNMELIGRFLKNRMNNQTKPPVVAASTIGALAYSSKSTVIDMLGLTDSYIAHHPEILPEISEEEIGWKEKKYNARYVLSRKPEYIIFSTIYRPSSYAERALFTEDEFLINYYLYFVIENSSFGIIYKRKPIDEVEKIKSTYPANPNYSPRFISLYSEMLKIKNDEREPERTEKLCNEILTLAPPYFYHPLNTLGEIYEKRGSFDEAKKYYQRAIEIDSYNTIGRYNLLKLHYLLGEMESFRYHLGELEKYNPEYAKVIREGTGG